MRDERQFRIRNFHSRDQLHFISMYISIDSIKTQYDKWQKIITMNKIDSFEGFYKRFWDQRFVMSLLDLGPVLFSDTEGIITYMKGKSEITIIIYTFAMM